MSLSEGTLFALVQVTTDYRADYLQTSKYVVISALPTTNYTVSQILPGIFLGKQNAVDDTYVEGDYFAGALIN